MGAAAADKPLEIADASSPTGYDVIMPAFIQDGSGTDKTWLTDLGDQANLTDGATFTTQNNLEENSANALVAGLPAAVTQFLANDGTTNVAANAPVLVVEGFSAGSWISEANTVALDRSATGRADGVNLGQINFTASTPASRTTPYTGTPGTEAPVVSYYSGPFGRDLYVGLPWTYVNGSRLQVVKAAQSIFGDGANPAAGQICQTPAQGLLASYGFIQLSQVTGGTTTCGQETNTVGTTGTGS
jgi:hypothetical protein